MLELLTELGITPIDKTTVEIDLQAKAECDRRAPALLKECDDWAEKHFGGEKKKLTTAKGDYEKAYKQPDYPTAVLKLDAMELANSNGKAAYVEMKKKNLENLRGAFAPRLAMWDKRVAKKDFEIFSWGKSVGGEYVKNQQAVTQKVSDYESVNDPVAANDEFSIGMSKVLTSMDEALKKQWEKMKKETLIIDKEIEKQTFKNDPALVKSFGTAKGQTSTVDGAIGAQWTDAALDALLAYEQALGALRDKQASMRKTETDKLLKMQGDGTKIGDIASQAKKLAKKDPGVFAELVKDPQGAALLDKLVASLKGEAGSSDSKALCQAAIIARCGLTELSGDLTKIALPKLYNVLKDIPASHTRDNEKLQAVKREREVTGASFYRDKDDLIVLRLKRQGKWRGSSGGTDYDHDPEVPTDYFEGKTKDLDYFNATTLHEVGHAVDAKVKFMGKRMDKPEFGGWRKETADSIAEVAAKNKGFYTSFPNEDQAELRKVLVSVLLGKDKAVEGMLAGTLDANTLKGDAALAEAVKLFDKHKEVLSNSPSDDTINKHLKAAMKKTKVKDEQQKTILREVATIILKGEGKSADSAVQAFIRAGSTKLSKTVTWKDLAKHDAVKWCQAIRMKGTSDGLWEQKEKSLDEAIGGRVYQQSYSTEWNSYDGAARKQGVSSYQFRAPAEWFAELYAVFYMKKMTKKHPAHKWLTEEIHALA